MGSPQPQIVRMLSAFQQKTFLILFSEIEDCTQTWTFDENSIDYVHMRYLIGSIKDWPALMKEAFRVCKPGGYVESYEGSPDMESDDDTVPKDSAMADWGPIFKEAGAKISRPFTILHEDLARKAMEEAGFVDIESRDFKVRQTTWYLGQRKLGC